MQERYWAAVVSEETYAEERLYSHDAISLRSPSGGSPAPQFQEQVVVVAAIDPPVMFALGRIGGSFLYDDDPSAGVRVRYTHRFFDEPLDAHELGLAPGLHPLSVDVFERMARLVGADRRIDADKAEWFVSVALPIEASSPAEAVREFWTYVDKLGPRELPAFVWPRSDELAMQAFVLGTEANLDPEADDD